MSLPLGPCKTGKNGPNDCDSRDADSNVFVRTRYKIIATEQNVHQVPGEPTELWLLLPRLFASVLQ